MGGAVIDRNCRTPLEKLFVAGEDAGGVHGANRLGGNGICDSCVYGRQAGKALATYLSNGHRSLQSTRRGQVEEVVDLLSRPFKQPKGASPFELRASLQELTGTRLAWDGRNPTCRRRCPR